MSSINERISVKISQDVKSRHCQLFPSCDTIKEYLKRNYVDAL